MEISEDVLRAEVRGVGIPRKSICLFTGISYNTVSHWLNGFSNLTEANREKMQDAMRVFKGGMTRAAFQAKYCRINNVTI